MEERKRGRLRNKVFLMMAATSVVPIFIAGLLSVYTTRTSHKVDVANLEGFLLDQKSGEIDSFMTALFGVTQIGLEAGEGADIGIENKSFILKRIFLSNPAIKEIAYVGLSGKEEVRINELNSNGVSEENLRDLSKDESFIAARNGNYYMGKVYFEGSNPVAMVSSPGKNTSGNIVSVLRSKVSLARIQSILHGAIIGGSGYVYLVD
ncbi:MAG: hypothetical protein AAB655_01920, partial [Patescibacteria group bacterium]